jgi:hypothetical protein
MYYWRARERGKRRYEQIHKIITKCIKHIFLITQFSRKIVQSLIL